MKHLLAIAALAVAIPAHAQVIRGVPMLCFPEESLAETLTGEHGESQVWAGVMVSRGVAQVLQSEAGGWTIVFRSGNGEACIAGVGSAGGIGDAVPVLPEPAPAEPEPAPEPEGEAAVNPTST